MTAPTHRPPTDQSPPPVARLGASAPLAPAPVPARPEPIGSGGTVGVGAVGIDTVSIDSKGVDTVDVGTANVGPAGIGPTGRFVLGPTTRVLWRGPDRIQLETGQRAVVVEGIDLGTVERLTQDDENRTPTIAQFELLARLHRAGYLARIPVVVGGGGGGGEHRGGRGGAGNDSSPTSLMDGLLAPDLAALGGRIGDQAAHTLIARRERRVAIHGGGRLAVLTGALLAAAGIGHIHVGDLGDVHLRDAMPGGLTPADEGTRVPSAIRDALHRAAPVVDTSAFDLRTADLVIVTTGAPVSRAVELRLGSPRRPHLLTGVWGSRAVVGPLVLPGRSSCLTCADLHRQDRDPSWPLLAAQLASGRQDRTPSEVGVCGLAAAVTALQSLQWLDGDTPTTVEGTIEFALPDWRLRRRSWPPHPDCLCRDPSP